MELQVLGIPLTFLVLFAIVLWFIILGKGKWWLKAAIVPVVLYFSIVIWFSLSEISGWASPSVLPDTFILHWSIIKEPSKKNVHDKGDIFLWATEVDEDHNLKVSEVNPVLQPFTPKKNAAEPRSYRLPYTRELHENLSKAMKSVAKGGTVVGKGRSKSFGNESKEGKDGGDGKGKGGSERKGQGNKNGSGGSLSQDQEFMFYELPPPKLPEKITGEP